MSKRQRAKWSDIAGGFDKDRAIAITARYQISKRIGQCFESYTITSCHVTPPFPDSLPACNIPRQYVELRSIVEIAARPCYTGSMLTRLFTDVDKWLQGWPSAGLSLALIIAALILVYLAVRGSNTAKALAVAYVYLP